MKPRIVFFGSSLVSAYWNGAATYYRGIIRSLHASGYAVTFYEPDAYERQRHRDMPDPDWASVEVYPATEAGVGFAGNQDGEYILPGFMPAFDASATLVKVLDLLAFHGRSLSDVTAALPKVHVVHETVVTPWEQKGAVMRSLVEQSKDREVELVDGVKVRHGDGWALALPDPEEPITHIWAEADSDAEARRLAQEYGRRIRQMVR